MILNSLTEWRGHSKGLDSGFSSYLRGFYVMIEKNYPVETTIKYCEYLKSLFTENAHLPVGLTMAGRK